MRKKPSKRKASKKAPRKKAATKKPSAKKATFTSPKGYKRRGGILVPDSLDGLDDIVPKSKLEKGLADAKASIRSMAYQVADALGDEFGLAEIELELSFNADGKFLGFGVGGATSVRVKFAPSDAES